MIKKVGILTWHYYSNFGSSLQAFALQHTLSKLGKDVSIINYHNPKFGIYSKKKRFIIHLLVYLDWCTLHLFNNLIKNKFPGINTISFQTRVFRLSPFIQTSDGLNSITSRLDCVVFGSDQIWAPNVYNPVYMGCYVSEKVRKISYAASIGLNEIPDNLAEIYRHNLLSFQDIAVREQEGKELLKRRCGIDASVVLDPTLMVDVEIYKKMQRSVAGITREYIFCYFLNKDHRYKEKVQEYARIHNLQIIGVSDNIDDASWMMRLTYLGADQFLWLIDHAETIFTDSYHGSIFSLLFHKNLWVFVRFSENNPICQNSRIRQLQTYFDIGHRIISNQSFIDDAKTIDYDCFEARLAELRESSMLYLKKALE